MRVMQMATYTVTFMISIFIAPVGEARWRTMEEAAVAYYSQEITNTVRRDGTSVSTHTVYARCLLDGCRDDLGTFTLVYNKSVTRLRDFTGRSMSDGKWSRVSKKDMDTRDAAGFGSGFDDIVRTMVAFPSVRVGTELKMRWVLDHYTSPIRSFYSDVVSFGHNALTKMGARVHYISEMPLHHELFGPSGYLQVNDWKDGAIYHKLIVLNKDAFFAVSDETSRDYFAQVSPGVLVSSHNDWVTLSQSLASGFERELKAPLPAKLMTLSQMIATQQDEVIPRIDALTTWLADHVRYMGDWRTVSGYYAPRPLDKVMATGFGDCKDYATVTAAVLRQMGYQAEIASVYRGSYGYRMFKLPTMDVFNHAIVKVTTSDGKVLWIDPTNRTSYAAGKRPDIAGKGALVLTIAGAKELENIPPLQPVDKVTEVNAELSQITASTGKHIVKAYFRGIDALNLTGIELFDSKADAKRAIIEMAGIDQTLNSEVEGPQLNCRQVQDVAFEIKATGDTTPRRSTAGLIHQLEPVLPKLQTISLAERVTAFRLGEVGTSNQSLLIKGAQIVGEPPAKCSIDTPWISATRSIQDDADDLRIVTSTAIKKISISSEEIHSAEVASMIQQLKTCFGELAVVYELR